MNRCIGIANAPIQMSPVVSVDSDSDSDDSDSIVCVVDDDYPTPVVSEHAQCKQRPWLLYNWL